MHIAYDKNMDADGKGNTAAQKNHKKGGRRMKKRLLGTLTLAMAVSMGMAAGAEGDIVVLYTNDVHCAVAQDDENQVLGYAKVAALKEELEEAGQRGNPCGRRRRYPGRSDRHALQRGSILCRSWTRWATILRFREIMSLITGWSSF